MGADMTGIGKTEGWLCLAAIDDISSRMPRWLGGEQGTRRTIGEHSRQKWHSPNGSQEFYF